MKIKKNICDWIVGKTSRFETSGSTLRCCTGVRWDIFNFSPIKGYRCFPFTVAVEIDSNNYQSNKLHSGLVRFCRVA